MVRAELASTVSCEMKGPEIWMTFEYIPVARQQVRENPKRQTATAKMSVGSGSVGVRLSVLHSHTHRGVLRWK